MAVTGNVDDITRKFQFEWRIDDFFSLPIEDGRVCYSPLFSFAGESWYLGIYPNGQSTDNSVGHVGLYLLRDVSGPPTSLEFCFHLKTFEGKKYKETQFTYVFQKTEGYGCPEFLKRSTLLEKNVELVPSDTLTVVCTVEHYPESTDDAGNNERVKCSHCEEYFDAVFIPSHEQKCLDKPIKCPTCADVVALRKWLDHECERTRVKATEKLADDLENILGNKEHSDVTVKVKDEKFHLHRCILAGRNPYFNSMFKTEMREKTTGVVIIEDCEPDVFRSFIHFVYTGKVSEMSLVNVCGLYEVADMYQEDRLKEECLCFMRNKMTVESICDFIALALRHDEKDLLQNAIELFCRKTKDIIQTVKWQTFMREYPTEANEMYLKAVDYKPK